jgi:hypothetical protein
LHTNFAFWAASTGVTFEILDIFYMQGELAISFSIYGEFDFLWHSRLGRFQNILFFNVCSYIRVGGIKIYTTTGNGFGPGEGEAFDILSSGGSQMCILSLIS